MNTPTKTPAVATHTPTPWHVGMKPGPFIYGPQGEQVADMTGACTFNGKQDAAFIVRACNSHAQLVAALDRASMVAEYANLLSCCKTIKEATDAKLYSKLATALVEFREARAVLQSAKE